MNKKVWLSLLLVFALAACGGGSGTTNDATAPETAKSGEMVRVAMDTEIDSLYPYKSAAADTATILDNMFDGLVDVDENGEVIPNLAKSWEISEDGLTYTFHLQEGVKFHNGADFTADDVMYSLDKLGGVTGGEAMNSKYKGIATMEKVSDYEVKVVLKEKNAAFLTLLKVAILPKGYEEHETHPIGAGPFKFVSRSVGEQIVMERNEEYYLKDKVPQIPGIVWIRIADEQTKVAAMKAGEVDILPRITPQVAKQLEKDATIISGPQNLAQFMGLNNKVKPLDDVRVRKAINFAVDRDEIIASVAEGRATKISSNLCPVMKTYYNTELDNEYPLDLDRAKALLKEAGYENGFDLKLTVPSDYQFHMDTAQVIANQLSKVGINVIIDPIEFSTWLDRVHMNRDYQATIIGYDGKLDPAELMFRYASDYPKNFTNYSSAQYDELLKKGLQTTDIEERAKIYKEAQAVIVKDAGSVFIQDPDRIIAVRPGLEGLKLYLIQKMNMEDVHYTK